MDVKFLVGYLHEDSSNKSCKEIIKTVSSDEKLKWHKEFEVRLHLMMCIHCRKYAKQIEIIKFGFIKFFKSKSREVSSEKIKSIEDQSILDSIKDTK